jgi:hypothetical protein
MACVASGKPGALKMRFIHAPLPPNQVGKKLVSLINKYAAIELKK